MNFLVSISNTKWLERDTKMGKACVLKLMSFGDIINDGEVSPFHASSLAYWLRASSEYPLTLTDIAFMNSGEDEIPYGKHGSPVSLSRFYVANNFVESVNE